MVRQAAQSKKTKGGSMALKKLENKAIVPSDVGGEKKKRRFKNRTLALRDIKRIQKSVDFLMPRKAFYRIVRYITSDFNSYARITENCVNMLQEIFEAYVVNLMRRANLIALDSKLVTVMPRHISTVMKVSGLHTFENE